MNPHVETREINGRKYTVTLFPAETGFLLFGKLKRTFGSSIGAVIDQQIEMAIEKLGGQLTDTELLAFAQALLESTTVEGEAQALGVKEAFNRHFTGRYGELFKVLAFVVEVNYADFFDEIKKMLEKGFALLGGKMKSGSNSQTISDLFGQSSESSSKEDTISQQ